MLNPLLYEALLHVFPRGVRVVNENAQGVVEVHDGGQWDISKAYDRGEQYLVHCPFCEDRHGHLYISYASYMQPEVEGRLLQPGHLMAYCQRSDCIHGRNFMALDSMIRQGMSLVGDGTQTAQAGLRDATVVGGGSYTEGRPFSVDAMRELAPEYTPCLEGMPDSIAEYLASRRVTEADMELFRIGHGRIVTPRTRRLLNGGAEFVILPIVREGRLQGYQARCPDSLIPEDGIRYWTHPGMHKSAALLNLDSANACGMAVVCEGPFDAISVGFPGVACFGHGVSRQQRALLSGLRALVMLPDTDVRPDLDTISEARRIAADMNSAGVYPLGAHVVVLPAKDAGSLSRQEVWTAILRGVPGPLQDLIMENIVQLL